MDKIRFLKTVYDIGFKKLILRLFFDVRAKIDYLIPFNLKNLSTDCILMIQFLKFVMQILIK